MAYDADVKPFVNRCLLTVYLDVSGQLGYYDFHIIPLVGSDAEPKGNHGLVK